MFNGANLLANEQTAFPRHNLLIGTATWATPALRSTAAVGHPSTVPVGSLCQISSAGDMALKVCHKISNSLPTSVMVLNNKALGPSIFHLGWQPEEILKRESLKLITVILVSPARSPVYWKEVYAISTVSKTSQNKKKPQLITPWNYKRNTMPIQQLNSVQTQLLCCYISFSIKKPPKTFF